MPVLPHLSPRGRIARRHKLIDDADWVEVRYINSYAAFMGYLSMAVKGLGFLVFTWTTVVLLGGFVSVLEKKDFWCLTVITLLQTRAFNGFVREKLSDIGYWYSALFSIAVNIAKLCFPKKDNVSKPNYGHESPLKRFLVALMVGVQVLVSTVILCPLIALHMSGLYITTGISLWRLTELDLGGKDGEVNLKLGLEVLYSLALLQGALFCYRTSCFHTGRRLAKIVGQEYGFRDQALDSVKRYLRDTRAGCFQDPSSAKGRNLLTYAVDLMGSQSPQSYLSGLRILDTLIGPWSRTTDMASTTSNKCMMLRRRMIIKQMIGSAPCSHILHKLLQTLDSTSQYDGEMRERAARIVVHLASDIRLEQFPRGIQCISSMLETPSQQDGNNDGGSSRATDYKELMLQGLCILGKLTADEDYCDAIQNTKGLLSKIIAPVSSDLLHCINHDDWSAIVAASLQVMCQIVAAAGNTAEVLRCQISGNSRAMCTMQKILDCEDCGEELCVLAIKILTQLDTKNRESFIGKLLAIFIAANKDSHIRRLAGEKLAMLSVESEHNARIILNKNGGQLTEVLLQDESKECRITAAWILESLCNRHYTDQDDECVKSLKEVMIDVMPKVLGEVLRYGPNKKEAAEDNGLSTQASCESCDLEKGQFVDDPQDSGRNYYTSAQPDDVHCHDGQLQAALLSFSVTVFEKLIDEDQNLLQQVVSVPPQDGAFSLARKLKEMVERNSLSAHPTVDCLRIVKLTTKIAIAMMKNLDWYWGEDMESLKISLCKALQKMSDFDGLMIISSAGGDHGVVEKRADVTLGSLVKEALVLLEKSKPGKSEIVPVSSVKGNLAN
uniref:Uncharacterized protein n=1 Tax=Avena sativa TaxID=4498 RepID=A0ACD5WU51_AVESA